MTIVTVNVESSAPGTQTDILTFPGTTFKYKKTKKTLASCTATLSDLRADFRQKIETVVTKMHELGFAFGVLASATAGYRSFAQQAAIGAGATNAGPGESFHQYGIAADLGCLDWVDENGTAHGDDFWLGAMSAGFASAVWNKRNEYAAGLYSLSFEIIHFQSVPANTSGTAALVKCLNAVATEGWQYRRTGGSYECNLGGANTWKAVGTALQMWNGMALNCTADQAKKIQDHMKAAETTAKTIDVP